MGCHSPAFFATFHDVKFERPLCDMERAFWLLDRGTCVNGLGVVTVRGPLDEGLVQAGLAQLSARHPLLRVRVVGDDRSLRFSEAGAGPIPLRVLRQKSAEQWQQLVEQELNLRFAADADHLVRVTLLMSPGRSELIITAHHVIADALSIVFMVRDLLTNLAELLAERASAAPPPTLTTALLPPIESLPLLPPMPALLPRAARGLGRLGQMNAFFRKHVLSRPFRPLRKLPIEQSAPPEARRNCLVQRTLPPEQTRALGQRAHTEGASVHGALCAALLLATAEVVYAEELAAGKPTTVGCFAPINLRDKLDPPVGADLGLYISQVTTFHQIVPRPPLWELARAVKTQLTATLESGEQYLTMPLIGMFIPWGKEPGPRFIRRFDGGSPGALGVSNLARPPIPGRYGPLSIENLHLAVGVSVVGQLLGVVTTWEDQLTLNLVFVQPLLSRARAQRIAEAALGYLRAALATSAAA